MNAKKFAALALVILIVIVALAASVATFVLTSPASEVRYQEPASAVDASLGQTATDGTIALRLNGVSDAATPATSSAWIMFNHEAQDYGVYGFSLTPPPGDSYLVANVTVANVRHAAIPFSYTSFLLVSHDGTAYYSNYAVCSSNCSAQVLAKRTLSENFTSDIYTLFSVPASAQPLKLVYTAANPPIVMSSV